MESWKWRQLSRGAKVLFIQTVTNNIPLYAMQITLMHKGLVRELESINRTFLWGSLDGERHCHSVSWEVVCFGEERWGLGYGT